MNDFIQSLGLPVACDPSAFGRFLHAISEPDSTRWLVKTHAMFALNFSNAGPEFCQHSIDQMAAKVNGRVRGNRPQARMAHLHDYLFEELGFKLSEQDWSQIDRMILPGAIAALSGLPTILAVIYKSVAEQCGLYSWGLPLPGHFLCGIQCGEAMFIDVAAGGRSLSLDEVKSSKKYYCGVMGTDCDDEEYLRPATNKHWLSRSIQNVLCLSGKTERSFDTVAKCLEMEIALWPDQIQLIRDLALALARAGDNRHSARLLAVYLQTGDAAIDPALSDLQELHTVLTR